MKLTIVKINRKDMISSEGKPWVSVGLLTKEYGDKIWLSGFGNAQNKDWKPGDMVEVEAVDKVIKGDKSYLNFVMPKPVKAVSGEVIADIKEIKEMLKQVLAMLQPADVPPMRMPQDDNLGESTHDDLPF